MASREIVRSKIKSIKTSPNADVYDITTELNHNFFANGVLVHNCGEQPLVAFGSCNLGSVNLTRFVNDAFGDEPTFELSELSNTVKKMVVMMDRMLDVNYYPLQEQADIVQEKRQIGLGITGLGDMLAMLKLKYSSEKSRNFVKEIMGSIRCIAFRTSIELAKEFGAFPLWDKFTPEQKKQFVEGEYISTLPTDIKEDILKYGIRNSRLLSIAPCGTISLLMNNVSSGAEPIFMLEYDRKVKTSSEQTVTETVETYSWKKYKEFVGYKKDETPDYDSTVDKDYPDKPDYFETIDDLTVEDHIEMQAVLQLNICTAISKTINIPEDYSYDEFKGVYDSAYINGLKGCTTYRPNKIIGSVLSKKGDNGCGDTRPDEITFMCAPKRPKRLDCEIHHCNVKGKPWLVIVGMYKDSPYEIFAGEGDDLYIPKTCKDGIVIKRGKGTYSLCIKIRNSEVEYKDVAHDLMTVEQRAMTRLVSLSLRHGVPHEFIVKQLRKSSGDITDFSAVINRVLNSYIKQYQYEKEEQCPECDDGVLMRQEGCKSCNNGCGYSKCG